MRRWRDVIERDDLENYYPTPWTDIKKQINVYDQEMYYKQAHNNEEIEGCGSKYIKYLHQMCENSLSFWDLKD